MSLFAWGIFSTTSFISFLLMLYLTKKTRKVKDSLYLFGLLTLTLLFFSIYGFMHFPEKTALITYIKEISETFAYIGLLLFGIKYFMMGEK